MRIADMNWMQVEAYLQRDDRCVLPIGCTEQHAYLSLAVDAILAERVAVEAAEPLGVPVFPALPFGITPSFMSYPGTVTLKVETMLRVVHDLLDSDDTQVMLTALAQLGCRLARDGSLLRRVDYDAHDRPVAVTEVLHV